MSKPFFPILALPICILLTSCGGSNDNNPPEPEPNTAPSVSLGEDLTLKAGDELQITAQGSDADGDALTYEWSQTSGPDATITTVTDDGSTVAFDLPAPSDTPLVFTVTVTDEKGESASDDIAITIEHIHSSNYLFGKTYRNETDGPISCRENEEVISGLVMRYKEYSPGPDLECFTDDDVLNEEYSFEVTEIEGQAHTYCRRYLDDDSNIFYHEQNYQNSFKESFYGADCSALPTDDSYNSHGTESYIYTDTGYLEYFEAFLILSGEKSISAWSKYVYDTDDTIQQSSIYDNEGPDGMRNTADDVVAYTSSYHYDSNGYLEFKLTKGFVNSNIELRTNAITHYKYNTKGVMSSSTTYDSPGEDMDWFTVEDNSISNEVFSYLVDDLYPITAE